jgi:uncharacterized membrane protein
VPTIEESIEVGVPVRTAYNQWKQFEEFPLFMEGIERVEQKDETRLSWVAHFGGKTHEWDAEITEQEPDRRVAWMATDGKTNGGVVTFHRLEDSRTRVMVQIEWDAEGLVERFGGALGLDSRRVRGDLERFKEMIESRGEETGAWRGEVEQERVDR